MSSATRRRHQTSSGRRTSLISRSSAGDGSTYRRSSTTSPATSMAPYISDDLANWLQRHDMAHVRGAPYHPMTQGKIERWHQTLKNRILLENYYLPGDLEAQIDTFVTDYNHRRYHESINNLDI